MPRNATITMRIEGGLKSEVENIFRQLGLTTTEAINIFLTAVRNRRGLPFSLQLDAPQPVVSTTDAVIRQAALDRLSGKYQGMSPVDDIIRRKQEEIDQEEQKVRP
jgi:addiction module RelB/DinJ family antitoxin